MTKHEVIFQSEVDLTVTSKHRHFAGEDNVMLENRPWIILCRSERLPCSTYEGSVDRQWERGSDFDQLLFGAGSESKCE